MDFEGKKKAEKITNIIFIATTMIGCIIGMMASDFLLTLKIQTVGFFVVILTCLPEWAHFNKNPVSFLKVKAGRKK